MNPEALTPLILTRIFITEDGDLVVSDLWEDISEALFTEEGDNLVF